MNTSIAGSLNPYLSDLVIMYLKLHDLHWNVKGRMFVQIHAYTERRCEDMAAKLDEVAEKIVMNGETPVSSISEYMTLSSIDEFHDPMYSDEAILGEILKDLTCLREKADELHDVFEEKGIFSIVSILETHIVSVKCNIKLYKKWNIILYN